MQAAGGTEIASYDGTAKYPSGFRWRTPDFRQ